MRAGLCIEVDYLSAQKYGHHGPIVTYLARCENDDCKTFDPTGKKVWFKVDEMGFL